MRIVIIPDLSKRGTEEMALKIRKWLGARGQLITMSSNYDELTELAIVIGGDGFIVKQAKELTKCNIPLVGVNFGTLGFLALAEKNNWQIILNEIIEGKYTTFSQPIIHITKHCGYNFGDISFFRAVSDVYIRHSMRMARFSVEVDGEYIFEENIRGDGVIVATSIGSTGYNFSAGGHLIDEGIVITPICPHPLKIESIALGDFKEIVITYHGVKGGHVKKDEDCYLFVDGTPSLILPGNKIAISKLPKKQTLFVITDHSNFLEARNEKLRER